MAARASDKTMMSVYAQLSNHRTIRITEGVLQRLGEDEYPFHSTYSGKLVWGKTKEVLCKTYKVYKLPESSSV